MEQIDASSCWHMNSKTIVVVTVDRQQQLWLLDCSQKDLRYGPGSFFLEEALKMDKRDLLRLFVSKEKL